MATKWKNKIAVIVWILLLSYGINGLLVGFTKADYYFNQNYFQTDDFDHTLNEFIDRLAMFEIGGITSEEAKKKITVTKEEIEEHRYRYGNLNEQITNIKGQYEEKIQDAVTANNEEVVNFLKAERDQKIADITANFTSDDHVRQKIMKEKEAEVDQYFIDRENLRPQFITYKNSFKYYLKNNETGKVYTNLNLNDGPVSQLMNNKNMAFIKNYTDLSIEGRYYSFDYKEQVEQLFNNNKATFEGQIAVPKTSSQTNTVLNEFYDFKKNQATYYIYCLGAIVALVLSIFLYKNTAVVRSLSFEKIEPYYKKVPVDVKVIMFAVSFIVTWAFLVTGYFLGYWSTFYQLLEGILYNLFWCALFLAVTLVQAKLLFDRYKDRSNLKDDLKGALLIRMKEALKSAFLNRRVGTQAIIILGIVFAFGLGAAVVAVEPAFIVIYAPAFLVVGLPILIILLKRIGYFNRIVKNTSELASGNFEPDLPIVGKSVLAKLAGNINTLKYGVKASQKEQAKSERLKTELITNVSHDLRTPLTSIITYTELLKTPDLGEDERDSYLEIIDRKSKRLKVLIDDLFEASKMASGNIELIKEKVDLVQLLEQALAEYNEKIDESTLQFRVTNPEKPVHAVVDGQKMWRVFDNIIGNILKYSLENTRVYISMNQVGDKVEISFKNIAKYELGGDVNELFERFKRGDASRQTEGSGLGLAIAKSIVDLHDGEMDIDVDGDLFKVTILLNLI
ncbi:signal transduction histidine kinase [Schinkia azotoformans MEV2011]|uniref:histidine kinase n=1 Tax=Schinkia azotoformans MEV2011 TaxID=1348973 RepID=A0A072NPE3_SCHAZ|nr:HAMP domain-containing sensor histidine kinase [Schinkia azotoformans]KEF38783.1 signal transduction histidine kinase [Schinkia azotoformans MEV2011]MEC1697507.1 histidine kinase dimerization/phospho-acceptor domain-containing protein [Schinkia azotoformans]MEC1723740.1 histidine kinase dimerization/phospho-acceptor domain-containing protein [Schinkia azotoformans]MEC1773600.1 histidine kinase dimerization/phospho-acceptor domain-containing protein [Schinkia azotoformans]MEC1778548.1 histid